MSLRRRRGAGYDFGRSHWRLLAKSADDPFASEHYSPDAVAARLRSGGFRRDGTATTEEYRLGVLDFIRERGPRAVVLDEAQHMLKVRSARSQADQLDVIKDSVHRTGVPHVLVGTYELSAMMSPNDQLARRSQVVHFAPYMLSDPDHRSAFQTVFGQLVRELPFDDPGASWTELRKHLNDVFVCSAGCVGVLKDWLQRALLLALRAGRRVIDWHVMERTRTPDRELFVIATAIRDYRELKQPTLGEVRALLNPDGGSAAPAAGGRRSRTSRPGKRRPVRDSVGFPSTKSA